MAQKNNSEHILAQRKLLPEDPGVYIYRNKKGRVLYIGKARNLKKRVNSYFQKALDARLAALVMQIDTIETIIVKTENEALLLEQNLIQENQPPYNIRLRDGKSYPFIAVTLSDEYPRVLYTREKDKKGWRYFGPYSNARAVRETLEIINRIFPYRCCEGAKPGRHTGNPCLDYHLHRCAAPCVGYISQEDYRAVINQVMDVLNGNGEEIENNLREQMKQAAAALEFEKAGRIRNRIQSLQKVLEYQNIEKAGRGSFDVIGMAHDAEYSNVQLIHVRQDKITARTGHYIDHKGGAQPRDVLEQFLLDYYRWPDKIPTTIYVSHTFAGEDLSLAEETLTGLKESAVNIRAIKTGDKADLVHLAERNGALALGNATLKHLTRLQKTEHSLEELREELNLESLPLRIECYDISNMGDEAAVGSMAVFEHGMPNKAHYRNFKIKRQGQNDFANIAEVIRRRFKYIPSDDQIGEDPPAHLAAAEIGNPAPGQEHGPGAPGTADADTPNTDTDNGEKSNEKNGDIKIDPSFSSVPNLIVIDGGKGQLAAALAVLQELKIERVAICSLAKRLEEIYLPGNKIPLSLPPHSPARQLLEHIRNETHRIAVKHHRTVRQSGATRSILDTIPGVGPTRRRALLTFFKTPEKVMNATCEELTAVPGLSAKQAKTIYDEIQKIKAHQLDSSPEEETGSSTDAGSTEAGTMPDASSTDTAI